MCPEAGSSYADPQRGDHLRVRRENQLRITIHISKQLDCLVREFPNLRIWIECPSGNDFWKPDSDSELAASES